MSSGVQIYDYNEQSYIYVADVTPDKIDDIVISDRVTWLNFHGFKNTELVQHSFDKFQIHKLTREDILKLSERPKIESYENYVFVTLKSVYLKSKKTEIVTEQISFVLSANSLISYQERKGDLYNYVRKRIELDEGIVRKKGADYLLYLLIEATLRGYIVCLNQLDEDISSLNERLRTELSDGIFNEIEQIKEKLRLLKQSFHPFRDQISKLVTGKTEMIQEANIPFFNDVRDNILYTSDEIDSSKSELDSLSSLYFARLSQRSNEIMQFLTIVAAIFIPLTFIAGVYGMNFKYMPELQTQNGYFMVLGAMLIVAVVLIFYFKKRKWF